MKEPMEVSRVTSGGPPSALGHIKALELSIQCFGAAAVEKKVEFFGVLDQWRLLYMEV